MPPAEPKAIFIVDDNATLRLGLRRLIERESDLEVIGEAESISETKHAIAEDLADCYIVDLGLGHDNGLDLIALIKSERPDTDVIVLSWHNEYVYRKRSIEAGADAYVVKSDSPTSLIDTIRSLGTQKASAV